MKKKNTTKSATESEKPMSAIEEIVDLCAKYRIESGCYFNEQIMKQQSEQHPETCQSSSVALLLIILIVIHLLTFLLLLFRLGWLLF